MGDDVFYFDNDAVTTKVLDNNKNELGTLQEYLFEGKTVTSGSVTNIKHSGVYKIKGLSGLPSEIPSNQYSILEVKAIGNQDNPDVIFYKVTSPSGVSKEMTVSGSNQSGWTLGGVQLQNAINSLDSQVGELHDLATGNKSSLVKAVNELKDKIDTVNDNTDSVNSALNEYKKHNHDDRYIRKTGTGDSFKGTLVFENEANLAFRSSTGTAPSVISRNGDKLIFGNGEMGLNIQSKGDVYLNGQKVVTTGTNGLNADKVGGVDANLYARKDQNNDWSGVQTYSNAAPLRFVVGNVQGSAMPIQFMSAKSNKGNVGYISKSDGDGMSISPDGNNELLGLYSDRTYTTGHLVFAGGTEKDIRFGNGHMGFYFKEDGNGRLGAWDWDKNRIIWRYDTDTNYMEMGEAPKWQGRRLFLQDGLPTNVEIPYGSIWIGF